VPSGEARRQTSSAPSISAAGSGRCRAAALPASRVAKAETYPTRPVRLIVGFPAGGGADLFARLIGQWLSERLGQQFIVENRVGAGGNLAPALPHALVLGMIKA
jgi:tripartite-type tricarboxylate transporter receptor subunit TctC